MIILSFSTCLVFYFCVEEDKSELRCETQRIVLVFHCIPRAERDQSNEYQKDGDVKAQVALKAEMVATGSARCYV